jgi:ABC-2 type transport system permease protein
VADVSLLTSICVMGGFLALCLLAVAWIFKSGYQIKQ